MIEKIDMVAAISTHRSKIGAMALSRPRCLIQSRGETDMGIRSKVTLPSLFWSEITPLVRLQRSKRLAADHTSFLLCRVLNWRLLPAV
jgi:hypothetical protein